MADPSCKNTSSFPLHPPPSKSTNMNNERLMKWLYGYNLTTKTHDHSLSDSNSSSSVATNGFGSHAPGIIKAMEILEAQFGHQHASSVNNNTNDVNNNKRVLDTSVAHDHSDLPRGSTS